MRLRFGLAAWGNAHFEHTLYPLRTPHAERLGRYASVFDCVEADVLHHQDVDAGTMSDWIAKTPKGFLFLPKMSKQATHSAVLRSGRLARRYAWLRPEVPDAPATAKAQVESDVARAEAFLAMVEPLRSAGKLGPILLQFAKETDRAEGFDRLQAILASAPKGTFAVELRDSSWFVPAVRELLEGSDAPLVWSTFLKAFAPPWATGGTGYVRFTGKHAKRRGRHVTVADRVGEVLEVRKRLEQASWKECFVIVTNPFEGNAVDSIPQIAAALGQDALARRLRRPPGGVLFPDAA